MKGKENNLTYDIPCPIFSVENVQRHCNIPNILNTSISYFDDILHSSWWQCHIVRMSAGIVYVIVIATWLCRFQLPICGSQRPLLHLWGTTLDGKEDKRA